MEQEEGRTLKVLNSINEMIALAFNLVSKQPALLPLYRRLLESAVATMPKARQFDAVMESAFDKISEELNKPDHVPQTIKISDGKQVREKATKTQKNISESLNNNAKL